jgi:hypothetical protein
VGEAVSGRVGQFSLDFGIHLRMAAAATRATTPRELRSKDSPGRFRRCDDPDPKARGPPETLHEGQINGGGGDGGEPVWGPPGRPS